MPNRQLLYPGKSWSTFNATKAKKAGRRGRKKRNKMRENVLFSTPNTFWGVMVRPRSAGPISWVLFAIQQSNLRLFYEALCAPCHTNNNKTSALAQSLHFVCMTHSYKTVEHNNYENFEPFAFWLDFSGLWAGFPPPAAVHSVKMKSPVHWYSLSHELKVKNEYPHHRDTTHCPAIRSI